VSYRKLGVEYGITANPLSPRPGGCARSNPSASILSSGGVWSAASPADVACEYAADVAGPACYDFTGRGFTMKVDTPYSDSLQLAKCISCGRCVSVCPTGALTFNERQLTSFRVDESRCILCRECVEVCPVDALKETDQFEEARQKWLELVGRGSGLAGGHRMCAGCGAPIVVRQVLMGTSDPVVSGRPPAV